jgi:uncharacterized SAM-binding protein YcdF (DUF218 family)
MKLYHLRKKISVAVCIVGSIGLLVYLIVALYVAKQAELANEKKSDAILVLGARSYINGQYNPCLLARVRHATDLFKKGYAKKLVVTGGNDVEDGVNEAETMEKIAASFGVKASDIFKESFATSTYENFTLSKTILEKNNLQSVIIVSEPFHMARASLIAQRLGYVANVSPAKDSPCWMHARYLSKYFLKEPIAIMLYKFQGKL